MEKVNVLAEIPAIIRKGLSAATGTKPYIYQVSRVVLLLLEIFPLQGRDRHQCNSDYSY